MRATHRFCRTNRMAWPSWQDLYKAFNAAKHEDYPFATEVASRVQEGAFMDFGAVLRNWRDRGHPAGPPRFRKKRRTGAGSFRAASGVAQLRYDGKRRIRLPLVGSVKLAHSLPKGIPADTAPESRPEWDTLEHCLRDRMQNLVQHVLEEEVTEFLGRARSVLRSDSDRDRGYRNGYARARKLTLSSGTIEVSRPRVRNTEEKFESRLLPLFTRRTNEVSELIPSYISMVFRRETST